MTTQHSHSQFTQNHEMSQESNEFNKLLRTIQNEIQSPVLEIFDNVRVSQFKQMIFNQQQIIANLKNQTDVSSITLMQCQTFQIEISRIQYYLTLYSKTRLRKIHQMARCNSNDTSKMTSDENTLFEKYKLLRNEFLQKSQIFEPKAEAKPDMSTFVFVRILTNVDNFKIHPDDEYVFEMQKGEVYLFPYYSVHDFINTNTFELI
ncbi:Hypothetical protein EHI5A_129180 [Entamoeba histolytica KU27]|uniref:DNA replication complex GINS protein SLD5 n=1 Tax=Entamoeba histolytica KU27 TaxID=885311 RepID=M2SAY6_ENTHI|nr:Hypothetical protein EHI5A_129180 [Entamoeba histolytica KU27]